MGVQRTIKSASRTAVSRSSVARSTAPERSHSSTLNRRRTNPTTCPANRRRCKASPSDPPSKPTPIKVTFSQRTGRVSGFNLQVSSCKLLARPTRPRAPPESPRILSNRLPHSIQHNLRHQGMRTDTLTVPNQFPPLLGRIPPRRLLPPEPLPDNSLGLAQQHRNIRLGVHALADKKRDHHHVARPGQLVPLVDFRRLLQEQGMDRSVLAGRAHQFGLAIHRRPRVLFSRR